MAMVINLNFMERLLGTMLLSVLSSSCGGAGYSGSYTFPTAIIGIQASSPDEVRKLERQVTAFAVANRLDVYREAARHPIANPLQAPLSGDSFEYAPNPPDLTHGFSMSLQKIAQGCFIVQLSERRQSWTPHSLAALSELERRLTEVLGRKVHLLVRAKREQNWAERQRLSYVDPEWPDTFQSLCDRMNVSTRSNA